MKRCFKCQVSKPLTDFYRHPMMADGYLGKCQQCTRTDTKENYRKRRDQYIAYEHSEDRINSRRLRARIDTPLHRARYPEKYKARMKVGNALRCGRISKQPCWVCGAMKVEAHHIDYSRPLDVLWLCREHHRKIEGRASET